MKNKNRPEMSKNVPILPDDETIWDWRSYIENLSERDPTLEQTLLASDDLIKPALIYAIRFFRVPNWYSIEYRLTADLWSAFFFADEFERARLLISRKQISQDPAFACLYARAVLKDKFVDGEDAIASDATCAYKYARDVIQGRWPSGEGAIYHCPNIALEYTRFLKEIDKS